MRRKGIPVGGVEKPFSLIKRWETFYEKNPFMHLFLSWILLCEDVMSGVVAVMLWSAIPWPKLKANVQRPWCWERMKAGGEGDGRGWDGWMSSLTLWTWVWASSGSWWWTGKTGLLQALGHKESDMTEQLNYTVQRKVRVGRWRVKLPTSPEDHLFLGLSSKSHEV